ncbi:ankyrin repeat domain-containing protein, partial [archaeon]
MTVLHLAAMFDLPQVVGSLHARHLLPKLLNNAPRLTGVTALHLAALHNSSAFLEQLLPHEPRLEATQQPWLWTPHHAAAHVKALAVLRLLRQHLPQGMQQQDVHGLTPCDILARDGYNV